MIYKNGDSPGKLFLRILAFLFVIGLSDYLLCRYTSWGHIIFSFGAFLLIPFYFCTIGSIEFTPDFSKLLKRIVLWIGCFFGIIWVALFFFRSWGFGHPTCLNLLMAIILAAALFSMAGLVPAMLVRYFIDGHTAPDQSNNTLGCTTDASSVSDDDHASESADDRQLTFGDFPNCSTSLYPDEGNKENIQSE